MSKKKPKFPLVAKISTLHRVGGSLMVILPSEFIKAHGLVEGDKVGVLANHVFKLDPMKECMFSVDSIESES